MILTVTDPGFLSYTGAPTDFQCRPGAPLGFKSTISKQRTFNLKLMKFKIKTTVDTDQAALMVLNVIHGFGLPGVPWVSPMATGVTINH